MARKLKKAASPRALHPHPPPAAVIHAADCVLIHLNSLAWEACRDRQHKPRIIREEDYPPSAEDSRIPIPASKAAQASRNSYIHAYHKLIRNICSCISLRTLYVILYPFHPTTTPIAGFGAHTGQTQPSQFGKVHRTISKGYLATIQSRKTRWVGTRWA